MTTVAPGALTMLSDRLAAEAGQDREVWPGDRRAAMLAEAARHASERKAREITEAVKRADQAFTAPPVPPLAQAATAGQRLAALRQAARLTTAELSTASGISKHVIEDTERDHHTRSGWRTQALARGLAAADPRLDEAQVTGELMALPGAPVTTPETTTGTLSARALAKSATPATVRVRRDHRLLALALATPPLTGR